MVPITEAARRMLLKRARAYIQQGKYVTVHAYVTRPTDATILCATYGGNYYEKDSGWQWICGKRDDLHRIAEDLKDRVDGGGDAKERLAALFEWYESYSVFQRMMRHGDAIAQGAPGGANLEAVA